MKTFVGPADDPFFVDLGSIFDGINIDKPGRPAIGLGNQGGGHDDLAGYNVHSFVLQIPDAHITRDGKPVSGPGASNAVVGVWSSTERRSISVMRGKHRVHWTQVSRLGNPLINEVIIPIGKKDKYNATSPKDDLKNFGTYALNPAAGEDPQRAVQARRQGERPHGHRAGAAHRHPRPDADLQERGPRRHAEGQPGRARRPPRPNRFGALAGDTQGFPNGRRLGDDVTDIELRVIGGALLKPEQGGKQLPLGDGVDQNDKPFRATFPYVAHARQRLRLAHRPRRAGARAGPAAARLIHRTRRPRPSGRGRRLLP